MGHNGQVGPHLCVDQYTHTGLEMPQESRYRIWGVPRQPCLHIPLTQQADAFNASCGCAVGEQQAQIGVGKTQGLDEGSNSTGLTQRHSMYPQSAAGCSLAVITKALGDGLSINRFALGSQL